MLTVYKVTFKWKPEDNSFLKQQKTPEKIIIYEGKKLVKDGGD